VEIDLKKQSEWKSAKLTSRKKTIAAEVNNAEVSLNKSNIKTESQYTKLTTEYNEACQRLRKRED
jgi:hypothetical protein